MYPNMLVNCDGQVLFLVQTAIFLTVDLKLEESMRYIFLTTGAAKSCSDHRN